MELRSRTLRRANTDHEGWQPEPIRLTRLQRHQYLNDLSLQIARRPLGSVDG